jgi:hypothetical protein
VVVLKMLGCPPLKHIRHRTRGPQQVLSSPYVHSLAPYATPRCPSTSSPVYYVDMQTPPPLPECILKQPDVPEQDDDCNKESKPRFPPNASPLRHPQHSVHCPSQPHSRVVEAVVHLVRKRRGISNLIPYGDRDLEQVDSSTRPPT